MNKIFITIVCVLWAFLVSAQVRGAALLLPAIAPANIKTNKQILLHWDSSEPQFNIYTGSNRTSLAKLTTVTTNAYPLTRGVVYGISSVNFAGIESTLAYWPSNRVGELVTQTSTNLTTWTDLTTLETFTNIPVRPRQHLRIVDRTKQWLPPN